MPVLQNFTWQKRAEAFAGRASMWSAAKLSASSANLQINFLVFILKAPFQHSIQLMFRNTNDGRMMASCFRKMERKSHLGTLQVAVILF
ncbi:MAG TPA: hypothetical protein VFB76_13630 [Candidatus Angelobacter sp.]|nr:hypothetical protein [Candidatus Angelobacter sp.]